MAAGGSKKRPPSENESGVTLRTPMTKGRARCRALARSSINMLRPGAGEAGPAPGRAPSPAPLIVFVAVVLAAIAGVLAMSPAPARQFWLGFARPLRGVKPRL